MLTSLPPMSRSVGKHPRSSLPHDDQALGSLREHQDRRHGEGEQRAGAGLATGCSFHASAAGSSQRFGSSTLDPAPGTLSGEVPAHGQVEAGGLGAGGSTPAAVPGFCRCHSGRRGAVGSSVSAAEPRPASPCRPLQPERKVGGAALPGWADWGAWQAVLPTGLVAPGRPAHGAGGPRCSISAVAFLLSLLSLCVRAAQERGCAGCRGDEGLSPALWARHGWSTAVPPGELLCRASLPPFQQGCSLLEPEPGLSSGLPMVSSVKEMNSSRWGHARSDREHEQQLPRCCGRQRLLR